MNEQTEPPIDAALLADWRQRAQSDTLSTDEMRRWITHVRGGRASAAIASATSRAKKAPIDMDALMGEIDDI